MADNNQINFSYGIQVNTDSLGILTQRLDMFQKEVVPKVGGVLLDAIGKAIVDRAKQLAPVDTGNLRFNLYHITTKTNPPNLRLYSAAIRKTKTGGQAPYGWYQEVGWRVKYARGYGKGKYSYPIETQASRRRESIRRGGNGTIDISNKKRVWSLEPDSRMRKRNPGMSGIIKWREGRHYYRNAVDQTMNRLEDFKPLIASEVENMWKGRGWELVKY